MENYSLKEFGNSQSKVLGILNFHAGKVHRLVSDNVREFVWYKKIARSLVGTFTIPAFTYRASVTQITILADYPPVFPLTQLLAGGP